MAHGNIGAFVSVINFAGVLAFAFSGAVAAKKNDADLVGVLILSLIACSCGGLVRDILIGDLPPELIRSNYLLMIALAAGLITWFFHTRVDRFTRTIDIFDALGLGLFAVAGADKALLFGITPTWCVGMGLLTGVGGGIARDVMLAKVPTVLKSEIYITPALLGALTLVAGKSLWPEMGPFFMVLGAVACSGLRLMAISLHWHIRR